MAARFFDSIEIVESAPRRRRSTRRRAPRCAPPSSWALRGRPSARSPRRTSTSARAGSRCRASRSTACGCRVSSPSRTCVFGGTGEMLTISHETLAPTVVRDGDPDRPARGADRPRCGGGARQAHRSARDPLRRCAGEGRLRENRAPSRWPSCSRSTWCSLTQYAVLLILVGQPIAKAIGVALMLLPLLGAWALVAELCSRSARSGS